MLVANEFVHLLMNQVEAGLRPLPWMIWNTVLALVPLYLAARLFRSDRQRLGIAWWLGVAAFVTFLPNAPYVLTDLIHLAGDGVAAGTAWRAAWVIFPMYAIFLMLGFSCYVVSLIWLTRFLHRRKWSRWKIRIVEVALHAVCAFGIFLGRFIRLNTWDLVVQPDNVLYTVLDAAQQRPTWLFTSAFFIATCVLYFFAKHATIAVVSYLRAGGFKNSPELVERYM